jgi:hypothetical protein
MMLPPLIKTILSYAKLKGELQNDFELSSVMVKQLREQEYPAQWRLAYSSRWFHIKFPDLGLVTFQHGRAPSYQYLECPLVIPTYDEYVSSVGGTAKERYSIQLQSEYESVLDTAELRRSQNPMRYDYDEGSYRAGVHPAAHLHIGIDNDIRIGLDREMNPLAFLLFVIRQRYPSNWEHLLKSSMEKNLAKYIRDSLPGIAPKYQQPFDKHELCLR